MFNNKEVTPLIYKRFLEFRVLAPYYPENSELWEKQRMDNLKDGLIRMPNSSYSGFLEYGLKVPCIPEGRELDSATKERTFQEAENLYQVLIHKVRMFPVPFNDFDMITDASVEEVTISKDKKEIEILINGAVAYQERIDFLKVHMLFKDVQQYQINCIQNGIIVTDNQEIGRCFQYNSLGVIKDDFFWWYKDGCYSLTILITWMRGWLIQVDSGHMEVYTEKLPETY